MIDFIKLQILKPNITNIKKHPALEWELTINEQTGEELKSTSDYYGMKFEIKRNTHLNVYGSLHMHWNAIQAEGCHNHNDFNFVDLRQVILNFCKEFDLDPRVCAVRRVEFGVNVSPAIPVNTILTSVINYKGKSFTQDYNDNKMFRQCAFQQYIINIYNKGLQYNLRKNVLRFENKTIKMCYLRKTGIVALSDLLDRRKIEALGHILTRDFNDLLFYDSSIRETDLKPSEHLILAEGQNPNFWVKYKETHPDNYIKKRQRFRALVKKYANRNLQEIIGHLLTEKIDELLIIDPKSLLDLTDFDNNPKSFLKAGSDNDFLMLKHY